MESFSRRAPRIDTILNNRLPSFRDIKEKYHLKFEKKKYVLQVFHPVVTELENIEKQILDFDQFNGTTISTNYLHFT